MTVPPVHHLRSTPGDPCIVCANFSFKMGFRRKCGWWTERRTAEIRETQPEEAPRKKEGTRRKKRLLLFMQERQSDRKSRFERWRWKSFWKQQITPPDEVSDHFISGSLPGVFSNTAAESKQGDGRRRERAPAVSTVEHEMPETFLADSCSLGAGYKKQVSGKEKKAVRRKGQDNADEFVRFSEQGNTRSETDERKIAEEDVLAEDTQEDEGKDICSEYFRMTGPTNSPPPQACENTRNEGSGGSKSKFCINSWQEGRDVIPFLGRLPPAGEQPIFSPSHKGPSSGRSAADSTIIASHRNVPSTAATSCPPSPADTDQTSPFLSYPVNAASVVDCNLRAAGAAPVADASAAAGVQSLATAAVADAVAAKAALLTAAAIDEDGGVEFPAVPGLPISAATAVHVIRERSSVNEQRLGAADTQTQSGCKRYPSDVADRAPPVLQTDSSAVKSLKKTFPAAQRSAAGARAATAARQSAAPFRCSYLARKAAPFSLKRFLPSAAAAAPGAAPLQGPDLRAAERATTYGRVLQQRAEKTNAPFQQQTQQRRQSQEPNAQQYQPEQQHQWLRQQQPCRLQQPKALRLLLRAPLPNATHTQQEMTAQTTVRHGNSPLEKAEAIAFPPQLRFARFSATPEGAGGMPSPLAALLACPTGAARRLAASPTATAPLKRAAASSAARTLSSDATPTTAAANKSLLRRVLRSALVENAPGFVSSTATPAETATAAHEVVPENSSPFRCVQVHDSRGRRADASALSPLSASSFVVSLPSAAPSATAAALGTSHYPSSIRRGTRSHLGSVCTGHHLGYDTAIPSSMDISPAAAQIAAPPGPEAEAEIMSAPSAVSSSSVFSHSLTRSHAAPFRDSRAVLLWPSSAVAATCKTPLPSQSALSCPAALFSSPSLPARTRSSPDVQASTDQMLLPQQRQRRNSTPPNRAVVALCVGEMGGCASHQEGQNSSNCAAGDDAASSASSPFDGICSSNAESEKERCIATTCGLKEKQCRGEQAATIGVRIRNSTSSSITATGPGTTIYNTVHMTAGTGGVSSTSGGPSVGIAAGLGAAGVDAAAGHKQEARQLGLQHRGNRQQKPPEAVHPGCPCVVDNTGALNRQQRNRGGEKFCNETSVISVEDSVVAQAEDTTTRQQRGNADSPQLLRSSGSSKHSTRPSTPDNVAASPASQSKQTATTQGAAGAAFEADCFSSNPTRASLSSPREVSVFVTAHDSDVSAGHGALQNEQQHQCPTYHQQRQVKEGGQQQSEQERPAEEPEERQRLRNFPKQPTHLAQSNQRMFLASLQEGQSIQASLLSEQQPGDFCNKEPQQQQRPTKTDTSLHARPQVQEPLSVERVGDAQVNEQNNAAVQTCAVPGVEVSAADPPKRVAPACQPEVAAPAAVGDARDRCAALQTDALGIVVPLGCAGADGEAHNFGNTLHSSAGAVRSTALDLANKGQRPTISNPGAGEAAYADLPITAAAAASVEATAKLYSAAEDAVVDREPPHVDPKAVANSKGDQIVLAKSMRLVEPPPTATTTTTTPADVGGEASVATLGVTAAATLSKPSSPEAVTAATAERTSTLAPPGAAAVTLPAVSGKSFEATREPVEATTSSTHPPAGPAATNPTALPAPDRGGDARSQEEKEGALTLTEAVLATVGQGVTAALEYGATTLRDFITESLPALSSDEDTTPDCSPSHQCLQRRRSSNTWRSGRDTQTFTRPQRERGERSRCIRRTCSAGTTRAAEASLQSRWERITNSSVLLPPPLLVRECMQPSAAAPTRRGLPPLSSTSRSHRRSNSFSEAMHRSHLQPVWYSAVLDRTQTRRSVSPAVLPGAVATTAADGGVEIVADPTLQQERYVRAPSPALSEPPSLHRQQLPDRIMQMPRHPVAASAARRAVATAGMLVSDLQGASTLVRTLGGDSGFSRSGMQRSYSPLSVAAELCTAPSRMTGAKSYHPPLHTQTGRGLRPWQPSRSVCSPSAAAAGASWRSAAATPVSFSKITTPHALSPARTPHVVVPVCPTAAIIDSAAAAGPRAAGSSLEHTPAPASNGRASIAADNEKQRPRRGFVLLPPILPKSLQKEDRLTRRHLQQAAQPEQQQNPSDWQESISRDGQVSPLQALPGAGCISQTTGGNLPPQTGARGQLEEPSLAEHRDTLQKQHYRELQLHNVQQQQERQQARENIQPVAAPVMAELRFAAENIDSSVASPEWELRPSTFTSNGGLRQPSVSDCNVFGGFESHAVNRFSRDSSPHFPNCCAGGVMTPLQHRQAQMRQTRHLLQPPAYPTAADPHPLPAVGCQASKEHTAANSSAHPAQETSAARDAVTDQPFHNILTLGAGAETATGAAACVATAAAVRAPVYVEPQRVQYASSVTHTNWTRGSSDAPASTMDPLLCWERQQRPCEYLESHRQQQRPEEIHAVHPGPAALEVRGNSPGIRVRHSAGTLLAAAGGSVGTHFTDESHLAGGEERRRSSLLMIPNLPGVPSWNPIQQQQQRMQRGAPPELPPLPTAASGQGLEGLLQAAGEPAADKVYEEGAMAAPPSTHRGERVVIDRAAAVAPMQDAAALAGEECTWGASHVPARLPSAKILPTILNTGTPDLGTASVGALGASSPVCADLVRERADRDAAQTAVPASATTAARRARGDGEAAVEVGPQAGAPVPAMDKTRACPPWGQPRLSNLQFTFQQQELQHCQELSELRQRQRGGPVQQSRPPSPLRARQLREELLRQHAAGQLSKDNFPLEEVESLLQDFHVRKVNGVLIYNVEGQETSRCPVPQSEAAGGAAVTFCLPDSRTAVGFGSDGRSTAGRQRAVTEGDEEFRIRTTANANVRPNRCFDNSSSYSQTDRTCCNNSSECSSAHVIERLGGNTGSQSALEGSRYDRPSTHCTNSCFDTWVRENHRVGEQFLKDVEQIVDVAANLYATDETGR